MSDLDESDWSTDSDSSDDENEAEVDLKAPKPIKLKTPVWDAKFHPSENILVSGDLDGVIRAWRFDDETNGKTKIRPFPSISQKTRAPNRNLVGNSAQKLILSIFFDI